MRRYLHAEWLHSFLKRVERLERLKARANAKTKAQKSRKGKAPPHDDGEPVILPFKPRPPHA